MLGLPPGPGATKFRPTPVPSIRVHRVDEIGFFIRYLLSRATANDGSFSSGTVGYEAYVHYGHAKTPTQALTYWGPDDVGLPTPSSPPSSVNAPLVTTT